MADATEVMDSDSERRRSSLRERMREGRWGYAFVSPFYILFAIFSLYPMLLSIYLSFTRWKGVGPMEFAGLVNFRLIPIDKVFWQSMLNGVIIFLLYVPIMLFLALALAVILNSGKQKTILIRFNSIEEINKFHFAKKQNFSRCRTLGSSLEAQQAVPDVQDLLADDP